MDFTINGLLIGLLAMAIGAAFAFYGFRVFLILLPIWGFFAGFLVGASFMEALFPDSGFLIELSGWIVGFILGLVFAVLSYLYFWAAVILLGGVLGYQFTYGVVEWLNLADGGIVVFLLALVVGAAFAVAFFVLHMPAVLVIVATAISGAGAVIAGIIVALGLVPVDALNDGIYGIYNAHDLGIVWLIAAIAVAFAGAIYQTRTVTDMAEAITADRYMNPGIDKGAPPPAAAA